ncbi:MULTISPECIES: diaminopimelate decarboxylase [unclassified Sphingobium]|uniref:diaminopimelate decarboxylase n=1 Tax=unclassified Sphingobium TaxID=2611147 RepID=UPI000D15EEBE|nr:MULTISPECIES: diaminopimelate decarboxylase [unclassified Sphingobium]MBG6118863.1 diaminopimelate decarboxylase [Sphingobium sp. JAI105]PSO13517.1 diaminopimelate decarboxylase [Sphingobium sp. AEW4]TWD10507.1 diaminopimelate decarboxylase [Sphingobium sp. AEW010]TWD28088.1 diaminopimelate decarboxylase [Sphingobium sp. AEW013]TWD28841.1 diaminopimelate decarboxylase [Sphingobium sp. AEW001]
MDHFDYVDGAMQVEQVPMAAIADAVGTPVYVYSTATLMRHVGVFRDALGSLDNPLIAFAVKANPNAAVLATLAKLGLGADVVSGGELLRAIAAGIPADRIVFSGVGKTAEEMRLALDHGIFQFNLESEPEAEMLSQVALSMGKRAPVAYRINPDVDAGTHAKISTGKSENKFGIPYARALESYAAARDLPGLDVQGVAVHIGSQLTDLAPLEAAFTKVGALIAALRDAGHDIRTADLGGGLGVPYDPALPEPPSPAAYGDMVCRVTQDWPVRLMFEPGRVIVGNAGALLSRVVRVKQGAKAPFVIVDAAMNDLLRPSLYDAWHDIRAVIPAGQRAAANVVGPVCETGDTFAMGRDMDVVAAGDLVAFMTAGAYGATMAGTYNSRPLTPEVLVSGDKWAVVRARPPIEALIAGDSIPDWLAD